MKKINLVKLCLLVSCLSLVSCGGDDNGSKSSITISEEAKSWFTSEELAKVHLDNFPMPTGCNGKANAYTSWYNEGYSFSQPCPSEEVMNENAEIYFNYFEENYSGKFGLTDLYMIGETETFYYIVPSDTLSDYADDNPSPLYEIFYVTDIEADSDGFLKEDAVYSFEIRYEMNLSTNEYMLKMYIEKANVSHNGVFTYKYKLS